MPTRTRPRLPENNADENYDASFNKDDGMDEFVNPSNRVVKDGPGTTIQRGWARPKSQNYEKIPRFTVPEDGEEVIIKFLEEDSFAPHYVHWINKRPYTCPDPSPDPHKATVCPACARGDKAKPNNLMNVVVLGDKPELVVWYATADPSAAIEEKANSKKGPLNKAGMYMAVSKRKGSNGIFSYTLDWVREDELKDDWGLRGLTTEELAKFNSEKYDSSIVRQHTVAEIAEVARQYLDEE